jgi:hypothetical protein
MQQHRIVLKAELIHKFLTQTDDKLDTLIMCKTAELITTDQALYEALASIEDKASVNLSKLTKLLEVTDVVSHRNSTRKPRYVLSPERAEKLRKRADKEVDYNG